MAQWGRRPIAAADAAASTLSAPMPHCISCAGEGWEYELGRKIGSGSFGSVWQARRRSREDPGLSFEVAVKFPRLGAADSLRHEIDIVRQLAHRGVVECLDVISESDVRASTPDRPGHRGPCLVMRSADSDLKHFFDKHGVVGESVAREWSKQLADAVAHLHYVGVVHRDIKPSNVLVFLDTTIGKNGFVTARVALADFGGARRLPEANPAKRFRITGKSQRNQVGRLMDRAFHMTARVCTFWYRAPELMAYNVDKAGDDAGPNACRYGTPVDVWSYGAVVYEMLLGKPLARAVDDVDAVACLLGVLGPCSRAPAYTKQPQWQAAVKAASQKASRRCPMPGGAQWDVPRACLQWCPAQRVTAATASRMPWLVGAVSSDQTLAAASSSPSSPPSGLSSAGSSSASLSSQFLRLTADWSVRTECSANMTCTCSGNCRSSKHRQDGGCDCTELVVGCNLCVVCVCKVPGCGKPKHRSDWCYMHKRAVANLPEAGKLSAAASHFAPALVPLDVIDFIDAFPKVHGDVALSIVVAMVKEPSAVRTILEFDGGRVFAAGGLTGPSLHDALLAAIRVCASTPDRPLSHRHELEQLNRQGVARFFGLAATAMAFGVIVKTHGHSDDTDAVVRLGLTDSTYRITGDSSLCDEFVRAVRAVGVDQPDAQHDATSAVAELIKYAERVRCLLRSAGEVVHIGTKQKKSGYVRDFIVRKLCLGWLALWSRASTSAMLWEDVPIARWRALVADSHEHVSELPSSWSSSQASAFVCGRPDWPFLTSMYMCMWKEVADVFGNDARHTLDASSHVLATIASFRKRHGFAPHPYVLVKACM